MVSQFDPLKINFSKPCRKIIKLSPFEFLFNDVNSIWFLNVISTSHCANFSFLFCNQFQVLSGWLCVMMTRINYLVLCTWFITTTSPEASSRIIVLLFKVVLTIFFIYRYIVWQLTFHQKKDLPISRTMYLVSTTDIPWSKYNTNTPISILC